jgi:hypothetical protein
VAIGSRSAFQAAITVDRNANPLAALAGSPYEDRSARQR